MTEPLEVTDAELRAWAKEHGIDDVPTSGRLSAAWREQISAAMLTDPAETVVLDAEKSGAPWISDPEEREQIIMAALEADLEALRPTEYRSQFVAEPTWVSSQTFTN